MHKTKYIALRLVLPVLAGVAITLFPSESRGDTNMLTGVRRVVFVGDSLTDGSAWTSWVMSTLAANGYPELVMHDAAVAGNRIGFLKARFTNDVLALKPDLVILHIGTNDRIPASEYRRDLEDMVKQLRQASIRMLLMTPPLVRDPAKDSQVREYCAVVRELAAQYQCVFVDLHTAFENAQKAGKEVLGPDGVHHKIDGWRTMGRSVLDALGCHAPMIEKVPLYPQALTEWFIAPAVAWKSGEPHPPLPEIKTGFNPLAAGWRKFDRAAEIEKTSWWQKSWLERGGIMPMGQEVVKDKPGCAARDAGAFALAIVNSGSEVRATMHVGGSMGYAVWVNGELVWDGKYNHGYHPDADRFQVTLRRGANTVLVFSNWLFYISLGEI
ncbi:MAG: GDSL-type esterase/lipase family protein [bacterium]